MNKRVGRPVSAQWEKLPHYRRMTLHEVAEAIGCSPQLLRMVIAGERSCPIRFKAQKYAGIWMFTALPADPKKRGRKPKTAE